MSDTSEVMAFLQASESRRRREEWLHRNRYDDPEHAKYLLNPLTRLVENPARDHEELRDRWPLVVAVIQPEGGPVPGAVDMGNPDVWKAIKASAEAHRLGQAFPVNGGAIIANAPWANGEPIHELRYVGRDGTATMILGRPVLSIHQDRPTVFYSYLVRTVRDLLDWASNLYQQVDLPGGWRVSVRGRGMGGALASGFNHGWPNVEPTYSLEDLYERRLVCRSDHFELAWPYVLDAPGQAAVEQVALDLALQLDNAFGSESCRAVPRPRFPI